MKNTLLLSTLLLVGNQVSVMGFSICPSSRSTTTATSLQMNFFTDMGDMLTGGKIGEETNLPYSPPICGLHSISNDVDEEGEKKIRSYAIKERGLSFTGEDFDIFDITDNKETPYAHVRGAMLHLPGKDKMRIKSVTDGHDEEVCVLDRVLMAVTPSYDIYRAGMGAEKIGWIEKKVVSLTDTFDVYMEGKGGFGVTGLFKPPPAYEFTGDFLDRNFVMKNASGQVVAKVVKDGLIQFDAFNHYQVHVGPGMDAMLVLACACAIDEEFDEEHRNK
jgi:uncharacterized protein YxjI